MKLSYYWQAMRLHKPIGIFLLLWPTLWALWLASHGHPGWKFVLIFVGGVIVMRSAGCVINDMVDQKFDRHVARTQQRPLISGKISFKESSILLAVLLLCALLLVCQLNALTIGLSLVGAALAMLYPWLKRLTHLPQLGLGLAFSWGIPMAFAAVTNTVPRNAWILFFAAAIWPVIYDTMYAMTDREDDLKIGVKSTAILFGCYDRLVIGGLQILFVGSLIIIGKLFFLSWAFYLALILVAQLFIYQQLLLHSRDSQNYFKAFLNNHWVGLVIFIGIALGYRL